MSETRAFRSGGALFLVGVGPGHTDHVTPAAQRAIADAEVVLGYRTYIELIGPLLDRQEVIATGMTEEIARAKVAIDRSQAGQRVAVICSGDAGVYGMASLVFERLQEAGWRRGEAPEVTVVPGVTALSACAALVGAPLGHDFCSISMSDLLTPWRVIAGRLEAAAQADFVIVLYNPASHQRTQGIAEAREILLRHRSPDTPVALVKSAFRPAEEVLVSDLEHFLEHPIGMLTTVLIGSSQTRAFDGYLVTPRGYALKYDGDGSILPGQGRARPLVELAGAEPAEVPVHPRAPREHETRGAELRSSLGPQGASGRLAKPPGSLLERSEGVSP